MPTIARLLEYIEVNPKEVLSKGTVARKISMDKLQPFCRDIPEYELAKFSGGTKFRNGDTIMARITPCLENGKTAMVNILAPGEVGFGSTEFIVFRAKAGFTDPNFVYYLIISSIVRGPAVKSMVGSSGRQRVQTDVIQNLEIAFPELSEQKKIAGILKAFDDKIALNNKINENLQQQAFALFDQLMLESGDSKCLVSDVAYLNPKRQLSKNQVARCIDMSQLSTSGAFPSGWDMKPFNGGMRFINGDTLLARITPCLENGKTAYIDFLDKKEVAFGSTEYIVLAPREGVPPEYLYCLARYPAFVDYAVKNMNGSSGRQRVSADTIGKFVMNHPSEDALRNFGDIATALFMKMRYNSFENLRLVSLRDAILPRLMSGELDVSGLDL